MENWGLITYNAKKRILYNAAIMTEKEKYAILSVVGHEMAHMWFGNLVTMNWWNNIWLNEGFATYFAVVGADMVEEGKDYMGMFQKTTLHGILGKESYSNISDVISPDPGKIQTYEDIRSMFSSLIYRRGACLVRMMEDFLSGTTFISALKNYFDKYKYQNVVQDNLFEVFDQKVKDT